MDVRSIYLNSFENQNITKWLIIALFVNLAFFSKGFYSFDEHFQILEFMNYKFEGSKDYVLAWEFNEKIRSWLLPGIFYFLRKILFIENPFWLANIFRIFSSCLFLGAFFLFFNSLKNYFTKDKCYFILFFSAIFWPTVYFAARTSSENYSQIFLLFAVAFLLNAFIKSKEILNLNKIFQRTQFKNSYVFFSGLFLGLSFEARFQTAFILCFLGLWFLLNVEKKLTFFLFISSGFCVVLLATLFIDKWGYGEFVFPPYRYFYQNIVQNVASRFGTSPFYGYFLDSLTSLFSPLYLIYFGCAFYSFYKKKFSLFIFAIFPFYIAHFLIPHKEGRFLIPAMQLTLIPVLAFLFDVFMEQKWDRYKSVIKLFKGFMLVYLFLNLLLLIYYSFSGKTLISYYYFLYKHNLKNEFIYNLGNGETLGLTARFYDKNKYHDSHDQELSQIIDGARRKHHKFYFLYNTRRRSQFLEDDVKIKEHCGFIYSSSFISDETYKKFPKLKVLFNKSSQYRLYECGDR